MAKIKARVVLLDEDNISLVANGGSPTLEEQLRDALAHANETNQSIFARYSPTTLQLKRVKNDEMTGKVGSRIIDLMMDPNNWNKPEDEK